MNPPKEQISITKNSKTKKHTTKKRLNSIDETIAESFPASDPPAWTAKGSQKNISDLLEDKITLTWQRITSSFDYEIYNRDARLTFAGGENIQVSNPVKYFGNAYLPNSEELLIGAVSSCYMQTFLAIASKRGYLVKRYIDRAVGTLKKNKEGKMSISEIKLNLTILFEGKQPTRDAMTEMRIKAHEHCFIANSLSTKLTIAIQ